MQPIVTKNGNALFPVTRIGRKINGVAEYNNAEYVKVDGKYYPVKRKFVRGKYPTDFCFIIRGDSYVVDYYAYSDGESPNFTIDWGDGTESIVNSSNIAQRTHNYAYSSEWTITIKNYVRGWIQFYHVNDYSQREKLIRVLTPFPASNTRTSFSSCFRRNTNLISIPENLFVYNPAATEFVSCFSFCCRLTKIHERQFANNPLATKFGSCFFCCYSLLSIPEKLFYYNILATDFSYCFAYCHGLVFAPRRLFTNNQSTLNLSRSFSYCFNLKSLPEGFSITDIDFFIGSYKLPHYVIKPIDLFFIVLQPIHSDMPTLTMGLSGDSVRESYVTADKSEYIDVLLDVCLSNSTYYFRYGVTTIDHFNGGNEVYQDLYPLTGYMPFYLTDDNGKIPLRVYSEIRTSERDVNGIILSIRNRTDKIVSIEVFIEDKSMPRLVIGDVEGDFEFV